MIPRPAADESSSYYAGYIAQVPEGADVLQVLQDQRQQLADLLSGLSDEQALAYPAPGEWNIKEVVGHINDGERVFTYRALRFSRQDSTPLPGFDQNLFAQNSDFSARPLSDLLAEFDHLRAASILLYKHFTPETLGLWGTASDYPFTVRALVYITAGHVAHHIESLRTVYLKLA